MSPSTNRNRHKPDLMRNNVLREEGKGVLLRCGHTTKESPLISSPVKRWWCATCHAIMGAKG